MNEQMLFQRMDYMKNPNLIFEENTLYEMDPNCMRQKEQDYPTSMRSSLQRDNVIHQEMEENEDLSEPVPEEGVTVETMLSPEQDEPVTNMFFQEREKSRNNRPGMFCCCLLLLLFIRS